jgi:hypothetical protein
MCENALLISVEEAHVLHGKRALVLPDDPNFGQLRITSKQMPVKKDYQ